MPLRYETLYALHAAHGHLFEIKRLDLPDHAPKHHIYHWLWVSDNTVSPLTFVGMEAGATQRRQFREAHLWFDAAGGELAWHNGTVTTLTNAQGQQPDALRKRLIASHLHEGTL